MTTNDGGPAFPYKLPGNSFQEPGMSLQDFFAASYEPPEWVVQNYLGMLLNADLTDCLSTVNVFAVIATIKYRHADAMLAERSKDRGDDGPKAMTSREGELHELDRVYRGTA